jgi:NAD(P)H-hydrate epimerase
VEVVSTAQMRELDRRTIELGTPGLTLMERAGAGVVADVLRHHRAAARRGVVVIAGRGNNGGDGFVIARLLRAKGVRVSVVLLGDRGRVSGDARTNLERWQKGRGSLIEIGAENDLARLDRALSRAGLIVDAIFGTGLNAAVTGLAGAAIAAIARRAEAGAPVVAVDIPSGLDGDTGEPWGTAVRATATVTFAAPKLGLVLPAARPYVGRLAVVDIGIAAQARDQIGPLPEAATDELVAKLLRPRSAGAHKGTNGHVLVVAGSSGKSGAAVLAGRASIRGGAGLTTIACPLEVQPIVASGLHEAMTEAYRGFAGDERRWEDLVRTRSALVIGPGLGQDDDAVALVHHLVRRAAIPAVVDADGLNAVARDLGVLRAAIAPRILTPHPGEMSRLVGRPVPDIQAARLDSAIALARDTGAVVVLKGAGTIVAAPDGRATLNTTGGPLLGTGGTGDVLSGVIGALLAQRLDPYDAARIGVFVHGRAGDRLAERLGDAGLLASELADELPLARHALRAR